MNSTITPISFAAIKGMAKVKKDDTKTVPIDIPDGSHVEIVEREGKLHISTEPLKAYAFVKLDEVDKCRLTLKNKAEVEIAEVGSKGIVKQEGDSRTTIDKVKGSIILSEVSPGHKPVAKIKELTGCLTMEGESIASVDNATFDKQGSYHIYQKEGSKSYIAKLEGGHDLYNSGKGAVIQLEGDSESRIIQGIRKSWVNLADRSQMYTGYIDGSEIDQRDRSKLSLATLMSSVLAQRDKASSKIYQTPKSTLMMYNNSQTSITRHEGTLNQFYSSQSEIDRTKKGSQIKLDGDSSANVGVAEKGSKIKRDSKTATVEIRNDQRSVWSKVLK